MSKVKRFSNFSRSMNSQAHCFRLDKEQQIPNVMTAIEQQQLAYLARGKGLSYNDSCLNCDAAIVDTSRLNHLLAFDETTGIAICQAGATFDDLFLFHPDYIPPVIPGTLHASIGGGVAHDIHGKNNPQQGTFGQHIEWIELYRNHQLFKCSRQENAELFFATIGGLGLTGVIQKVAIKLLKASRFVHVQKQKYSEWSGLLQAMQVQQTPYQVAWLDFFNQHAILSTATYADRDYSYQPIHKRFSVPLLPLRVIYRWNIQYFNQYYFKQVSLEPETISLQRFNNPLDVVKHWSRLYGRKGLLQFQGVFPVEHAMDVLQALQNILITHHAFPTLTVLKYFSQPGVGTLSFVQPGFTIAMDLVNTKASTQAIEAMNAYLTQIGGRVYLAKDALLSPEQFRQQYPNAKVLSDLAVTSSNLSKRLEITHA